MGRPPKPGGRDPVVPVRLPIELLEAIDAAAAQASMTRSEFIRDALSRRVKRAPKR